MERFTKKIDLVLVRGVPKMKLSDTLGSFKTGECLAIALYEFCRKRGLVITHSSVYSMQMARPLRIEYAGALYHVTSRGDRRENIFKDADDRLIWLELFSQVCSRSNWRCHAWCMMDNHYHMVIETVEGNLSHGMRQLNGVYTQKFNRRHGLAGHVC